MSRDEFKPRKTRPLSPLVYNVQAPMLPEDEIPVAPPPATRRRRPAHETSLAEEALTGANLAGAGLDTDDILAGLEGILPLVSPVGGLATARYNPAALGSAFGDALTLGNQAELGALAQRLGGEEDYDALVAQNEQELAREYARSPGSAVAGGVAGLANQMALPTRLAPLAGASRGVNALRAVAPLAAGLGAAGAAGGAIAAPEGERLEGAARGFARGAGTGAAAATLGAGANALRAAEMAPALRLLSIVPRGAAAGAEYGVLGTPGAVPNAGLEAYGQHAGYGAALGIPMEAAAAGLGGVARILARRNPPARTTTPIENVDESVLLMDDEALNAAEPPQALEGASILTPQQVVERARARNTGSPVGEAIGSLIDADPAHERLFSLTATGPGMRQAQRQGAAAFGSVRGLVDELQGIGIARPMTVYSREAERARALEAQSGIYDQIGRAHRRVDAAGGTRDANEIADALEAQADAFLARAPEDADQIAAANELRGYASRLRGGSQWEELPLAPVRDVNTGDFEILEGMRTMDPRPLTYPEIRSRMSAAWNAGRAGRQSTIATGSQSPQQRVAPMIYQAFRPFREQLAEAALGADYPAHVANQRASLALNAIAPHELRLDINANAQPANLRGNLGRIGAMSADSARGAGAGEQIASGVLAQLRENLIANYQHSLRATANELRRAAPAHSVFAEGVPQLVGPVAGGTLGAYDAASRAALFSDQPSSMDVGRVAPADVILDDFYDELDRANGAPDAGDDAGDDVGDVAPADAILDDFYDELERSRSERPAR